MQRKTYAIVDGKQLENNVKEIIEKYSTYKYYFGIVKNNAYHHGMKCVLDMIRGGINYFAVSSLEEALQVRKYTDYPVLCLEPISLEFVDDIINKNITITVESIEYLEKLSKIDLYGDIKVHLAVDSGMNRLGYQNNEDLKKAIDIIHDMKHLYLEGIYSHFATSGVMDPYWNKQLNNFLDITRDINLESIPIVHFGRSLTLVNHKKIDFCNGIRLGIIMYGFSQSYKEGKSLQSRLRKMKRTFYQKKYDCNEINLENDLQLKPAISLYTEVMSVRKVSKDSVIGYNTYKVAENGYVLTLPVGYADGVTIDFKFVSINKKLYPIVSDCMDMLMIYSSIPFKVGEIVEIFGKTIPISKVCHRINENAYHLLNKISNRVIRIHKNENELEEVYY